VTDLPLEGESVVGCQLFGGRHSFDGTNDWWANGCRRTAARRWRHGTREAEGLEAFVDVNPISILAAASRSLMEGQPDGVAILVSLAVAAVPAAVFLPTTTTRLYRSR
jgi:hypothetical protein